nr:immunoglobulin light chain junction region [Macaca mulatta]MPN81468.1 immunoglobulin light chain junction region [Macaca mulatta]
CEAWDNSLSGPDF